MKTGEKEKTNVLRLCKARKRFMKQAIESRYSFAASHVSYTQSLKNVGIALRRYAELEFLAEPLDKTPSHSSCPSPSHTAPVSDSSPLPLESPISGRCSYMRASGTSSVTVKISPFKNGYAENGDTSLAAFTMPPPPPPLPEPGSSWDYFDPGEDFKEAQMGFELDEEKLVTLESSSKSKGSDHLTSVGISEEGVDGLTRALMVKSASEPSNSMRGKSVEEQEMGAEREDPSEFITHRAKDFLSSIKDIEHRFFRASESGKEVSRMLEANKIRVGYSEAKVGSSVSDFLAALRFACCRTKTSLVSNEPSEGTTKVITWKRTTSSRSSSSRNHLTFASKDDNNDGSESDFVEEFCMISGSHSSTLERLYAWERKLYDEVKAIESIRKEYDRKCVQLRHQFAKGLSTHVIDKTRAVVKDLHSRIRVALHAVDAISKRIEKMRDDELQPQLVELIQGLIRMWKSMLECHHAQYITISLAYHAKTSSTNAPRETQKQIITELEEEIECFGLSFANWINSHTTYVEALNGWLQNRILQPREGSNRRRAFLPPQVLVPPIFVLSRDWSAGIKALPSEELSDAIKGFLSDLRHSIRQQAEEQKTVDLSKTEESGGKVEEKIDDRSSNLCSIHASLAKVLDRLTKFSEASLKMCEDIRQKCETARNAYYWPHGS